MITLQHTKKITRLGRKARIRKQVSGTVARPRLTVFRSARHIYAQVIDDSNGKTLVSASTLDKAIKEATKGLKKREAAVKIGEAIAERCLANQITKVVFDRNGYAYMGRVTALAQAARDKGLVF